MTKESTKQSSLLKPKTEKMGMITSLFTCLLREENYELFPTIREDS